jgi:hypothetical protein
MPLFEKMPREEVQALKTGKRPSKRQLIREQYVSYLEQLDSGEGGVLYLEEEENRTTARNRLKGAADDLNKKISFYRTRGQRIRFVLEEKNGDEPINEKPKAKKPKTEGDSAPKQRGRRKKEDQGTA